MSAAAANLGSTSPINHSHGGDPAMTAETTNATDFRAAPMATISIDLASLLAASNVVEYDEDDNPIYAKSFMDDLLKAAAEKVAREVLQPELRKALTEQIKRQVHDAVAAALDAEIRLANRWGEPEGEAKTIRQALADQAADEVKTWMKKTGSYRSDSGFERFLRDEVDSAVRADLNEALKTARADVKARMEAAAAKAIADAAASAVKVMAK